MAAQSGPYGRTMLNKVPEITAAFWIIKVLATTVGETFADFLSDTLGLGLSITSIAMAIALGVSLVFQFRTRRYVPAVYWLSIVLISIVGTLVSDNLTDNLGVPLWLTTAVFSVALAAVFTVWFLRERTLSIHTVVTTPRESFYWLTVLVTFALGTSAGDLIAEQLNLGYLLSLVLFAAAIAAVWALYRFARLNPVLGFWIAYVLTRPLGASTGDLLSQSRSAGGLGLGTTATSILFLAVILALVVYLSLHDRRRTKSGRAATAGISLYGELD